MTRFYSHINTAKTILNLYKGEMPFSVFIKNFFSKEKKYGSRDRREIAALCYNYFRIGFAIKKEITEERLITAHFLCTEKPNELLQHLKPEWNEKINLPLNEKIDVANISTENIFPFNDELSQEINTKLFNISFFIQPKLFVRIRPGKQDIAQRKLLDAQINFEEINESCFAFENGIKLDEVVSVNSEVVIQDLNSQRAGNLMRAADKNAPMHVWDCCAASGGKSMMAHDLFPGCQLTVSDVRPSIIQNLSNRFREAGIKNYTSLVADLTLSNKIKGFLKNSIFDLIICDAPCSGSGTWSRTPEQLLFFRKAEVESYARLQKNIVSNTISFMKKGGFFLYITCSVFTKENEEVVEFIQKKFELTLIKMELLKGYEIKADTMFAALFQNVAND